MNKNEGLANHVNVGMRWESAMFSKKSFFLSIVLSCPNTLKDCRH
jgi:hypothetical protein